MKSVVITGVSSGIGQGATRVLIQQGYRVFGSVRRQADADRLRQELGERFVPLLFDVTDAAAVPAELYCPRSLKTAPVEACRTSSSTVANSPVEVLPGMSIIFLPVCGLPSMAMSR